MVYRVAAAARTGEEAYTITGLINMMGSNAPPAEIAFPKLARAPVTEMLGTFQGTDIQQGLCAKIAKSFDLITCASICIVNASNASGYIYHANSGVLSQEEFNQAMQGIDITQPPYRDTLIAYAHPGNSDIGYESTLKDLVRWGVPDNNILQITNLFIRQFGLNNFLQPEY